jgi:antitoxin ParD1/3/4
LCISAKNGKLCQSTIGALPEKLMSTMNISLTPQLEKLVQDRVKSGRYTSASEVIREALRLLDEKDRLLGAKIDQLQRDIREGQESGPAAPWDPEEIKREGRANLAAKKAAAGE